MDGRDGWDGTGGRGDEPNQVDLRREGLARREATRRSEVEAHGVGAGDVVWSGETDVGGYLREVGKELDFAIGRTYRELQHVRICGLEL